MDIKKAVILLKKLDNVVIEKYGRLFLEKHPEKCEMLSAHNGQYILNMNALFEVDTDLAEEYEQLELAAPYLFLSDYMIKPQVEKTVVAAGYKFKRGEESDAPFKHYIQCENFSFGITSD